MTDAARRTIELRVAESAHIAAFEGDERQLPPVFAHLRGDDGGHARIAHERFIAADVLVAYDFGDAPRPGQFKVRIDAKPFVVARPVGTFDGDDSPAS
ncbi:MAG TPA: hypothetical protein VGL52_10065, partial [Casimicrobiaceae bacterium]